MSQAQQAQQAQQAHTRDQSSVDIQARAHDKRRVKVETDICFELLAPSFFAGKIKRQAHSLYSNVVSIFSNKDEARRLGAKCLVFFLVTALHRTAKITNSWYVLSKERMLVECLKASLLQYV